MQSLGSIDYMVARSLPFYILASGQRLHFRTWSEVMFGGGDDIFLEALTGQVVLHVPSHTVEFATI